MSGGTRSYEWFSDWVDQNLGLTLTLVRAPDAAGLLAAFGSSEFDQGERSFEEADELGVDVVRIGVVAEWAYAVEHFTSRGTDEKLLASLSFAWGFAVGVTFTQTLSVLWLARGGVLVTGFDIGVPSIRWGTDQHAFDGEMRAAEFVDPGPERLGEPVARFLELTTGVVITPQLLEGRLPCATLP